MSAPGFANLDSSADHKQNSTPNGGASPRCQNGPLLTHPSMYPPANYYGAPPLLQSYPTIPSHATSVPSKASITSSAHSQNYYQNNHQQQQQTQLPQHQGAPSPYTAPPPSQPYATIPSSGHPHLNAKYHQRPFQQQQTRYASPGSYYGQQSYRASPAQAHHQHQQQLVSPPACRSGAPSYPNVSYPSAPASSQYGTPSSSKSMSTQMGAPLHQFSAPPPASATAVQPGYSMGAEHQTAATVNGRGSTVQNNIHQHYDQSHQALHNYNSYSGVTQSSGGADGDRPPSGTPSASLRSSPSHHPGGDTSSSSTGSASPVPNNYDSLEGGSYPDSMPPSNNMTNQAPPFGSYSYHSMQSAYQHGPVPDSDASPSHNVHNQPGYQQYSQPFPNLSQLSAALGGLSGVPELEVDALRPVNLLQERNLLPWRPLEAPEPNLSPDLKKVNCSPQTFRCTLTSIPQTQALLNKARLPLGLLLHPFRDLQQLPVITSNTIVRCRSCRTYINPFVTFLDQRRWKCNLCYRVNDVPDEFMYNPVTRSYGEPHKRPEVQNSTVEFIASSDYMLRPPQPAVYLFVLEVSHNAVEAGYLKYFCESLLENLDKLPGDARTRVGFLTFDSTVHFYNLQEGLSQPQMLVVSDIDDVFIPSHDSLMVNLKESNELVKELLTSLPTMFSQSRETHSALGPALQAAFKLMSPTGGRVTVFQTQLPTLGAGKLQSREDPNQRSSTKGVQHLGPATDFYKKLALDCSGQQIGVDLFLLSSQYADLASLACISKYSAGNLFYYPSFHYIHNPAQLEKFQRDLDRYLTRKIGFEAVMRIRCTKGLSIHTFHGNFFVRSTDLLSLANVNPDSAFAVQMSIEDSLADSSLACFQAALLYTSSKGKRRIRVHTLCLPVVSQLSDVYAGADVQAITCLLANMAIDRSISSSLSDARDALVNAVVDFVSAYKSSVSNLQQAGVVVPAAMRLFPLYILALLKQKALRTGTSTRLDERICAMCEFKTQPLPQLMRMVHPDLYRLDNMSDQGALHLNDTVVPQPHLLHLSTERLSRDGAFLMDCGNVFYLWISKCCNEMFVRDVLGCPNYASIPPNMNHIPELQNPLSERVRAFLDWLQDNRAFSSSIHIVKDDASAKATLFQHLVEDRSEVASSYQEFLQYIQQQMSK
ncbi:Protein transport protein Sec24B [Crenichthys baileyi]|uniref:Protein transport protein Sec24B n=1 Tax=Crenichthys baileyi TaxID=28760 RepID=A0AAV9S2I2_9TELE